MKNAYNSAFYLRRRHSIAQYSKALRLRYVTVSQDLASPRDDASNRTIRRKFIELSAALYRRQILHRDLDADSFEEGSASSKPGSLVILTDSR